MIVKLKTGDDCSQSGSGVQRNPLGWRAYEWETPDAYPKVAPVPTTYVVRQAIVDERDGKPPIAIDYRYGKYQVDANAQRPLGFGWRESLNEFSRVLTRSEMVQDARARPGVAVETSCVVDIAVLSSLVAKALTSRDPKDNFPTNLCPAGDQTAFAWGDKTAQNYTCWNVVEGDPLGHVNEIQFPATVFCQRLGASASLSFPIVRQSAIWKSISISFELDGYVISRSTDTFSYDFERRHPRSTRNVFSTLSALDDGSSIETTNEYSDDVSRWFLGRLTKSHVTKKGDLVGTGPDRKTETRCSRFEYDNETGLLSAQEANCETPKAVTTRIARDIYGNVTTKKFPPMANPITPQIGIRCIRTFRSGYDRRTRTSIVNRARYRHGSTDSNR